jgi:hypothetical protein
MGGNNYSKVQLLYKKKIKKKYHVNNKSISFSELCLFTITLLQSYDGAGF